ncbi:MAG: chemotaxis protein CheC [Candidatus Omnitrophica bacterium]|nr:chemotaxis protein CheC [Candidatus Omnitrophota bacterium]
MEEISLTDSQTDALKEIGNICSGNAATALSQLLNRKISIVVPRIHFIPIEDVPVAVGGPDRLVVGLFLRVLGDLPSTILFVFSQKDALSLASLMTSKQVSSASVITELDRSALKEIGVILANAYLGSLSSFVGMGLVPCVPELIVDMAGAMVDFLLIELSCVSKFALLIESRFQEVSTSLIGHFFLIPNVAGLEVILKTITK